MLNIASGSLMFLDSGHWGFLCLAHACHSGTPSPDLLGVSFASFLYSVFCCFLCYFLLTYVNNEALQKGTMDSKAQESWMLEKALSFTLLYSFLSYCIRHFFQCWDLKPFWFLILWLKLLKSCFLIIKKKCDAFYVFLVWYSSGPHPCGLVSVLRIGSSLLISFVNRTRWRTDCGLEHRWALLNFVVRWGSMFFESGCWAGEEAASVCSHMLTQGSSAGPVEIAFALSLQSMLVYN